MQVLLNPALSRPILLTLLLGERSSTTFLVLMNVARTKNMWRVGALIVHHARVRPTKFSAKEDQ